MNGDPLTEWKFAAIADAESKRTIICSLERVDEIRAAVAEAGLAHRFTVQGTSSSMVGPSTVLVIDTSAMEGAEREAAQQWLQDVKHRYLRDLKLPVQFPPDDRPGGWFPGGVS